jgi:hypothetical protein
VRYGSKWGYCLKRRYFIARLFVFALWGTGCRANGWKAFSSEAGGFRISFPGVPKEETNSFPTPALTLKQHQFIVENEIWSVDEVEFLPPSPASVSPITADI